MFVAFFQTLEAQGHQLVNSECHHSIERIRLPIRLLTEQMRISCTVFDYIQPVICGKLSIWTHPTCIWRPRRGWPVEFCVSRWHQKTIVLGYCMTPCLAILVEHRLDRWPRTIAYTDMSTVRIEQRVLKLQLRMSGILFWNTVYSETQWLQVGNIYNRSNLTSPLPTVLTLAARESPRAYVFFVSPMSGHCANIPSTNRKHTTYHMSTERYRAMASLNAWVVRYDLSTDTDIYMQITLSTIYCSTTSHDRALN